MLVYSEFNAIEALSQLSYSPILNLKHTDLLYQNRWTKIFFNTFLNTYALIRADETCIYTFLHYEIIYG